MIWAGVIRVSSVGRRDVESDRFRSIADQRADIERAVMARGDTVHMLPPELDVSGGLPLGKRPALLAAVEGVEQGRYGGLAVAYLSRMGRDMRVLLEAWERVEQAGGRVLAVREGIDSSTAAGRLQRNLLAAIDSNQREQAGEMFDRQVASATERGIWNKRQTPKGYDRDPETRRLVPNADAALVKRAFRDRAAGVPVLHIADRLGMTASGVRALVRNRVYLGELRQRSYVNADAHPALVSVGEWRAAQTGQRPRPSKRTEPALLAGLVRCRSCGHTMSRTASGGGRYEAYACRKHHSGGLCPQPTAISLGTLDGHVEALALEAIGGLSVQATDNTRAMGDARAELEQAEQELAAYLDAVSAAVVGADAFAAGARVRKRRCEEAAQRLSGLGPGVDRDGWATVADAWDSLGVSGRNHALRGLLEAVVVRPASIDGGRVQVLLHGAGVIDRYRGGGVAHGLRPVEWLAADDPRLLRTNNT